MPHELIDEDRNGPGYCSIRGDTTKISNNLGAIGSVLIHDSEESEGYIHHLSAICYNYSSHFRRRSESKGPSKMANNLFDKRMAKVATNNITNFRVTPVTFYRGNTYKDVEKYKQSFAVAWPSSSLISGMRRKQPIIIMIRNKIAVEIPPRPWADDGGVYTQRTEKCVAPKWECGRRRDATSDSTPELFMRCSRFDAQGMQMTEDGPCTSGPLCPEYPPQFQLPL
jgi:hypothetical protein